MAVKLGLNDAAFRLGNQAVSVYLGAVEVYAPVVTLYFNGAVNGNWNTLGNWWLDSGHTVAAPSLPAAGDSVIATASITSNSGGAVTLANFTIGGSNGLSTTITVSGNATFNDDSFNDSTVSGNATFNDDSYNDGTVSGDATFNDDSANFGTVTGTITDNR